jgi:hypothetical protein
MNYYQNPLLVHFLNVKESINCAFNRFSWSDLLFRWNWLCLLYSGPGYGSALH